MKRMTCALPALLLGILLISCDEDRSSTPETPSDTTQTERQPSAEAIREERPDFGKFFADAGVEGTFLLYDVQKNTDLVWNPERGATSFIPASTFKIFNSLVALETGVIEDADDTIAWDGVEREIPDWNRTHDLRSAIKHSVVWYYQEIARRVGQERMQHYIDTVGYGNRNIGGGIDRFWLDGDLRISAEEQVNFLVRLRNNDLPFSQRTMDIVRDIMTLKRTDNYIYRGKTGWAIRDGSDVGWFVGYLQRGDSTWVFAMNIGMKGEEDIAKRKGITWQILHSLGLVEEEKE